jgi:uncharacterized membrane protein
MAGPASDYHRGEMDIQEQVSTFNLVMGMTKWGSLILAAFLLFVVIWFCTSAGFLSGLITGAVVLALGILLLRSKPEAAHQA